MSISGMKQGLKALKSDGRHDGNQTMQVSVIMAAAIIPGSFLAHMCCRGKNPMRGFLRERITCTWFVAIGSVGSVKTLKEVQSLKKDKSWIYPGRLGREYLKTII
jgi:hypothetical protein